MLPVTLPFEARQFGGELPGLLSLRLYFMVPLEMLFVIAPLFVITMIGRRRRKGFDQLVDESLEIAVGVVDVARQRQWLVMEGEREPPGIGLIVSNISGHSRCRSL